MKLHVQTVVSLTIGLGALAFASGCEDAAAKQRDTVQAQIHEATSKLQTALTGSSSEAPSTQLLTSVVAELGKIEGGAPGQNAAKAMLTATALREVARIRSADADRMESEQRLGRQSLETRVAGVTQLGGIAAALESVSSAAEREQLTRDLNAAKTEIIEVRARLEQLDGPISEHAQQIAAAKRQVETLRISVNDLRRKAQELGHANGLETYLQAVDAGRQADKIEYDISQREIDLDYSLTPELVMTDNQSKQLDSLITAIESALSNLEAFSQGTAKEIASTRQRIADESTQVIAAIKELDTQRSTDLDPAYEEAVGALERAAGQLRQVQGDSAQSARLASLEVHQTLGRLHWSRARALADHKQLLEGMTAAGGDLGKSVDAAAISAATTAHTESLEKARDAYTAAQELSTQVQGGGDLRNLTALSNNLGQVVSALGGTPLPQEGVAPPSEDPAAIPDSTTSSGTNFQTPEELLAYLSNAPKDAEGAKAVLGVMHAETPDGQRVMKSANDMLNAMASIDAAMRAKFNSGLFDVMGPAAAAMTPDYSSAIVSEQTDDRAVYTYSQMGQSARLVLRRIGGSWKIDVDDIDATARAGIPMQEKMSSAVAQAAPTIVSRIQSGELKSPQEVMVAFNQSMMSAMSGAMGGMSNPPPGPAPTPAPGTGGPG